MACFSLPGSLCTRFPAAAVVLQCSSSAPHGQLLSPGEISPLFFGDLWVRKPSGNHEKIHTVYDINVCVHAYIHTYIHTHTHVYTVIHVYKNIQYTSGNYSSAYL